VRAHTAAFYVASYRPSRLGGIANSFTTVTANAVVTPASVVRLGSYWVTA
jgi:hypothetical protein